MEATQNISQVIQGMREQGISLSLYGGSLKVEPKTLINDGIRESIRKNRDRIIEALEGLLQRKENLPPSREEQQTDIPAQEPVEKAPEATGRKWTAGNPFTCKCGDVTGWLLDDEILCPVCYQDKFNPPPEDKAPEAEVSVSKKQDRLRHAKPSPIALEWLQEHKQKLLDSGWTRSELYDRRKYRQGLAWLDLWEQAFSMAYLHEDGTIEFECSRNGKDFFWTARPRAMAPTKTVATMTTISEVKR